MSLLLILFQVSGCTWTLINYEKNGKPNIWVDFGRQNAASKETLTEEIQKVFIEIEHVACGWLEIVVVGKLVCWCLSQIA